MNKEDRDVLRNLIGAMREGFGELRESTDGVARAIRSGWIQSNVEAEPHVLCAVVMRDPGWRFEIGAVDEDGSWYPANRRVKEGEATLENVVLYHYLPDLHGNEIREEKGQKNGRK
jgi:hypothetical protein